MHLGEKAFADQIDDGGQDQEQMARLTDRRASISSKCHK